MVDLLIILVVVSKICSTILVASIAMYIVWRFHVFMSKSKLVERAGEYVYTKMV